MTVTEKLLNQFYKYREIVKPLHSRQTDPPNVTAANIAEFSISVQKSNAVNKVVTTSSEALRL